MVERIYNWAKHEGEKNPVKPVSPRVEIDDETLRDGLQGVQLERHPTLEGKRSYISWASRFVDHADIGFPGSEANHRNEVEEIIRSKLSQGLNISLSCAARGAAMEDVEPIIDISHRLGGYPLEADIFFDTSQERAILQGWDRDMMIQNLKSNIRLLKQNGLPVMFVPERSTTTPPAELLEVIRMAAELGVDRICIADTQGIANAEAIRNILRWSFENVGKAHPQLKWDAHFHNDRNLGVANCLVAAAEGVDRVHVTSFCIGERSGNVDLAALLVNLNLEGFRNDDLTSLTEFSRVASELLKFPVPVNAPVVGRGAHSTGSGVHASALVRGLNNDDGRLIYFAYDPAIVGAKPGVEISPFSGRANVEFKMRELGLKVTEATIGAILVEAKQNRGLLSEVTIREIARSAEQQ